MRDEYLLEGKALIELGLDKLPLELLGQWSRVLAYWHEMRAEASRRGGCGRCSRPLLWVNCSGREVCAHTGEQCLVERVRPAVDRWSIVNS